MIVFEKQLLKAFHNIKHEPFKVSMEICLPLCSAQVYCTHCVHARRRGLLNSRDNSGLPSKPETAKH